MDGEDFVVLDLLDSRHALVKSLSTLKKDKVDASKLVLAGLEEKDNNRDLLNIDDSQWVKALEIFNIIEPLVLAGKKSRTRKEVEVVATASNIHPSTVYRWLSKYEKTGLISSLVRNGRNDKGISRLMPEVEDVIQEVIEGYYLKMQRPSRAATFREVKRICVKLGLRVPDASTVKNRIFDVNEEKRVSRREGKKKAKEQYEEIKGKFPGADWPLAVVQIDHTPMDVIIVDDVHRLPIDRPYLTLATDVFSRKVVGFYISLDPPSSLSVGICISHSILTKDSYLASLEIDQSWTCWGVMRTIHVDNAAEFRGEMLGKACDDYGIVLEHRKKGSPNYGGHVERLFRTFMKNIHDELPGTTFSNIREKGEYDSTGRAVMTMGALEKWFTLFIVGVYHQSPHSGIDDLPPTVKWDEGIYGALDGQLGTGIPARVPNEQRLRLDFLPFFDRTVQRYGIMRKGINYWDDALRRHVLEKDPKYPNRLKKFICRYDPRNLSCIWVFISDQEGYIKVRYSDLTRPPISEWELKEAQRRLKQRSLDVTNEELIFKTIAEMREIVEVEARKTKSARRSQQRRKQWSKGTFTTHQPTTKPVESKGQPELIVEEDDDEMDEIAPFEDIQEPDSI
ncbi:MAG: Mu transposase C-terminal domain-containing protein [Candidatus Thiodiazotropha endolucinida]|nr:Mu transposase C-terminal domain-containing protein [Candidatus Thiodiazotropha endolucinida]